ncbi:MAG: CBS domain-containing protein [Anaerolineae bacterium]|nr:CBS domain-containing protein [Anaerolineae bacterium]
MLVRDVMTRDPVTVGPEEPIGAALELMRVGRFRHLPVVEGDRLVGIITDRDLRLATNSPLVLREKWYSDFILESIKVKACMTSDPITVTPDTPLLDAALIIQERRFGSLPVVEAGKLVGILTETDLLATLIRLLREQQHAASAG